jgi:glycosyltransferase involved in cell wall biosynthesis
MNQPDETLRVLEIGKFYPPHMGGIETHLYALCGELSREISVRVLVANDSRVHREEIIDGVPVTRLARLLNVSTAPICPQMVREIRASDADLVHIHLPNPAALLAYFASGYRGRLVLTWHSDIVRMPMITRAIAPVEHRALRRADVCIATSRRYLESSPILRAHRERCCVIPYGIRVERFRHRDTEAIARIRARFGPRLLLTVGRLIHYKGFEFLVRAMRDIDAHLLIVGDGLLRKTLENQARALGLGQRITFLGEMQNHALAPYYQAADIFVLPSIARSEAFGIVQLEAMACGVPVVNTRLDSGVPFVSLDGITGVTVPPADPQSLAAAINLLLRDPALRARCGAAAARRVNEEFTLDRMIRSTLEVYGQAVSSGLEAGHAA